MKDEGLTTRPELSLAEAAVNYLLQRIRVDADLRHHLLWTEAFAKLCLAEAHRTGESEGTVRERYSAPADPEDKPRLVECREAMQRAAGALREHGLAALPWCLAVIDELDGLT